MDFFSSKSYIRKTRPDHFVIGDRVSDPLVRISGKEIIVDTISAKTGVFDILFTDEISSISGEYVYITGSTIVGDTGAFNKIGIGTLSPQKELHVVGDTILSGHLYDSINSTGLGGYVLTSKGGGPQWKMIEDVLSGVGGAGSPNYLPKWEDEDTLINSVIYQSSATSHIGINTILPAHTLHVAGNTLVSGSLFISGNATSSFAPTENQHLATKLYVDTADAILSGNLAETGSNLQAQIDAIDIVSGEISHWHEAFEIDSSGEITPTTGIFVSDTMWMLNEDGGELNLEPRANLWRYNQGTAAVLVKDSNGDIIIQEADDFPEDISF
jgi:hypothetical protein